MNKLPNHIDTVEKLISIKDGTLRLECTENFNSAKSEYLKEYYWVGTLKNLFYNIGLDLFCNEEFRNLEIEEAYTHAIRELRGGA